jgi:hypothetical protein
MSVGKMNFALVRAVMMGAFIIGMLALPIPLFSQNCPLCYTQAARSSARLLQSLRSGILILIIPPMFMSMGITMLAYRKRNQFRQNEGPETEQ